LVTDGVRVGTGAQGIATGRLEHLVKVAAVLVGEEEEETTVRVE